MAAGDRSVAKWPLATLDPALHPRLHKSLGSNFDTGVRSGRKRRSVAFNDASFPPVKY